MKDDNDLEIQARQIVKEMGEAEDNRDKRINKLEEQVAFLKFMVLILFLNMLIQTFINNKAFAADCSKHPIHCQIVENHPTINKRYARKLSNMIYRAARKHRVPADLFTAILMQESQYKQSAKGCVKGLDEYMDEVVVCSDYGITQINYRTARRYGFDIQRIMDDVEYAINCGAKILFDFKRRYAKIEKHWWTRYNASSPDKRTIYKHMVERFLPTKEKEDDKRNSN